MTALDLLKELRSNGMYFPWRPKDGGRISQPSNSDIFRWLNEGAVEINGKRPKPKDDVSRPLTSLVFFPNNAKTRTTIL